MGSNRETLPLVSDASRLLPRRKLMHINVELLQVFKEVGGHGPVITELPRFRPSRCSSEQGWALVARDGKQRTYVADGSLQKPD